MNHRALVAGDRMLDQSRVGQIPIDPGEILEAEFVGAVSAVPQTRFLHTDLR
jgi:hypothetical protein